MDHISKMETKNSEKLFRRVDYDRIKQLSKPKIVKDPVNKQFMRQTELNTKETTGKTSVTALLKDRVEIKTSKSDHQKLSAEQLTSAKRHCNSKEAVKKTNVELKMNKAIKSEISSKSVKKKSKKDNPKKSFVKKPTTIRRAEDNVNFGSRKNDKHLSHSFEYNGNPSEILNHGSPQLKERTTVEKHVGTYFPIDRGDGTTIDHSSAMKSDLKLVQSENTTANSSDETILIENDGKQYSTDEVSPQIEETLNADDNLDEKCEQYRGQGVMSIQEYRELIDGKNRRISENLFVMTKSVNAKELTEALDKLLVNDTDLQSTSNVNCCEISSSEERLNNIDEAHLKEEDEKNESTNSWNGESGVFSAINLISNFEEISVSSFCTPSVLVYHDEDEFLNGFELNDNEICPADNGVDEESSLQNVGGLTSAAVDKMVLCTGNFEINETKTSSNGETLAVSDYNGGGSSEEQKAEGITKGLRTEKCSNSLQIESNVLDDLNVWNDDESDSSLSNCRPSTVIDRQTPPSGSQEQKETLNNSELDGDKIVTNQNDSDECLSREISWENTPEGIASLESVDELQSTVQDAYSGRTSDVNMIPPTQKSLIVASQRLETRSRCTDFRSFAASVNGEDGFSVTKGRRPFVRIRANRRVHLLSTRNVLRRRDRPSKTTIPPWAIILLMINVASLLLFQKRTICNAVNSTGGPNLFSPECPVCDTVGGRTPPLWSTREGQPSANGADERGRGDDGKSRQKVMWPVPVPIDAFLCVDLLQYCRENYGKGSTATKDDVLKECWELCDKIATDRSDEKAQRLATENVICLLDTLNDLTRMTQRHYEAVLW